MLKSQTSATGKTGLSASLVRKKLGLTDDPTPFRNGRDESRSMPVTVRRVNRRFLLKSRRQLFDIGVAGPLAGMVVAVPALALGLQWSQVLTADPVGGGGHMSQGVSVNSSMLLALVSKLAIGDAVSQGHYLVLHPLAFAGWLGLMITALNLLPVGQLDGGHIAHALFGRARAVWIGKVALVGMVVLGLFVWPGLVTWALIIYFVAGRAGLPPLDAYVIGSHYKRPVVEFLNL